MKKKLFLSSVLLSLMCCGEVRAQLVTYDFEGETASASSSDGNISASFFSRNFGGTVSFPEGNGSTDAISGSQWTGDSNNGQYYEFTLTANAGVTLDLASLDFSHRRSGTGPTAWEVSINGTTVGSSAIADVTSWFDESIALSGFNALSSATVRISAYAAEGSSGTWRLDDVSLDGLALTPVPEPSTWLLLAGGSVFLVSRLRRRK